ncbi:MAG: baseplate J/gp47 family protein [Lachnospiraceae bacterium]|nr:baseplate J/gp47 family protein [Lachnospiraceae bacterium]
MYEDMTAEEILQDMLSEFGADVRTDEGSLAWNACAKIADALESAYEDLALLRDNLTPDTMDLDHLESYSEQVGVTYHEATPAIGRGVFQQEIDAGTQFYCGNYTYTSGEAIPDTTNQYYMVCDDPGTEANTNTGELTPVDYVENYQGGEIAAVLTLGTDDEDTEAFRERVLNSFGTKSFGGNKTDYQNYINDFSNVAACKPKRRESDSPWINIWILDGSYGVPTAAIVSEVQDAVDPLVSSGEGDGMAPICHHVRIIAADGVTVNVSATVTLDTGYTVNSVKSSIETAIAAYLAYLREGWQENEFSPTIVRVAQIEARILSVPGVIDVSDVALNNAEENLSLTFEKVPIMGEVTLNV